jgi:radical SAM-linked protein
MTVVRVRFSKLGKIRWTSHRDVARMWERAFRRVGLPLAYTSGFSPRPRVSFGLALPTGHESLAEYLDLELAEGAQVDLEGLAQALSAALPNGLDAAAVQAMEGRGPSLQEQVTSSTWQVEVAPLEGPAEIGSPTGASLASRLSLRAENLMATTEAVVTRMRKGVEATDDIRPGIISVQVLGPLDDGNVRLECELAAKPRSLRPSELLIALDPDVEERQVRRLNQWIERDGARWEPLGLPFAATSAPHALERAS